MRTIKFRGLRIDGKGLIIGHLFYNNRIVTRSISYESFFVEKGSVRHKYEYIEVHPETVGQFTGLLDKNGKEIFEGDIFKINGKIYFVEWNEDTAGFILTTGKGYDTPNRLEFNCDSIYYSEIIGKIQENPELLNP